MMDVLRHWPALITFLGVSAVAWILLEKVLAKTRKPRRRQRTAGNVVRLGDKRPGRRRARLKIHPLIWLLGFAVLGLWYMHRFDEGPGRSGGRQLAGSVTHVRDGDTIEVAGVPVRFARLDCAELGTAAGEDAKRQMARLVAGQRLQCSLTGRRSYDRMIGECDLMDGRSLSTIMIREGHCGRWR